MDSGHCISDLQEIWDIWSAFTLEEKRQFLSLYPSAGTKEKPRIAESARVFPLERSGISLETDRLQE